MHRDAIAGGHHLAGFVVVHLMEEAEVLSANGKEAALDFHQFPAPQLLQELIVLANDRRVIVGPDVDAAVLARVIGALEQR